MILHLLILIKCDNIITILSLIISLQSNNKDYGTSNQINTRS